MEYVELKSDEGQIWRLRYSMRSLMWLESQTGESFQKTFLKLDENNEEARAATGSVYVLAAGLYDENRDVTIDDAIEIFGECGLGPTLEAIGKAIQKSTILKNSGQQEPQPGTAGAASKNPRGTGTKRKRKQPASA